MHAMVNMPSIIYAIIQANIALKDMRSAALTSPKANSNHALYKVQTIGSFVLLIFNAPMKHESPPCQFVMAIDMPVQLKKHRG